MAGRLRCAGMAVAAFFTATALATPANVANAGAGDSAITQPLEGRTGDPGRGRSIALNRATGNCLICHRVPVPAELFQGDLGPDLAGVGSRLSAAQLRLRMVDQTRLNPQTLMPPYYRTTGLTRVAEPFRGKPVLTAQEIEDVIAWLATLK
jgi:L-cysteine S-thiosulfotransferase